MTVKVVKSILNSNKTSTCTHSNLKNVCENVSTVFHLSSCSYGEFQAYCRQKKNKTFILKPDSGSQGKGIFLTKNPKVIYVSISLLSKLYSAWHSEELRAWSWDNTNILSSRQCKPLLDLLCSGLITEVTEETCAKLAYSPMQVWEIKYYSVCPT